MNLTHNKKIKISLADYPYKKDISNRLFLENLSAFEIKTLHELFYFGTKFPLSDLAEALDCAPNTLLPLLDNFSRTGLLLQQEDMIFVDKDLRKYFESQMEVFDETFEPDLEYFQKLLKKAPISTLPVWYNIPKTSDNIFSSIVEKYLYTPKLYEKHINELVFDEPLCRTILDLLFAEPSLTIHAKTVRDTLSISREKFQECMLLLEFHVACASSFVFDGTSWVEVVVPFKEYKDLCLHDKKHKPQVITAKVHPFEPSSNGAEPFSLFRAGIDALQNEFGAAFGSAEKSVREIEKACRNLPANSWMALDDCINWITAAVGNQEPLALKKVGKKWQYTLPNYSQKEKEFIKRVITDLFFNMNVTECGTYNNTLCFKITPFGRMTLGD